MIDRFYRCLRAEATKLWRQRLPWVGLVLVVVVTAFAAWINAEMATDSHGAAALPRNAFRFFAIGLRYGFAMSVFFLVLTAGLAVAGESGQGTLKMVLVRPVRRSEVLLAKAGVVGQYAAVLLLVVAVTAALVGGAVTQSDFGDVIDPQYDDPENPYVYVEAGDMWGHLLLALGLLVLPLLAAGMLGLTVSVLLENPGIASGTAVIVFLALEIIAGFFAGRPAARYFFNHYMPTFSDDSYVAILRGNAEGMSDAIWPEDLWVWNLACPALTMVVLLTVSLIVFRRKAILT
jgi:ABC-2 type transport system permease protein